MWRDYVTVFGALALAGYWVLLLALVRRGNRVIRGPSFIVRFQIWTRRFEEQMWWVMKMAQQADKRMREWQARND